MPNAECPARGAQLRVNKAAKQKLVLHVKRHLVCGGVRFPSMYVEMQRNRVRTIVARNLSER